MAGSAEHVTAGRWRRRLEAASRAAVLLGEAASVAQLLGTAAEVRWIEYPVYGMRGLGVRLAILVIPPGAMLVAGALLRRARARGDVSGGLWAASFAATSLAMWGALVWIHEMDDLPEVWGGRSNFCCSMEGGSSLSSQLIAALPFFFLPALVGIAALGIARIASRKLLPR